MPKIKLQLDKDTVTLVNRAYERMKGNHPATQNLKLDSQVYYVLVSLLNQWDAAEDPYGTLENPVSIPTDVEEAMRSITEPDIGLDVKVRDDKVTPRDTDGLIPWAYIIENYHSLTPIAEAARDYTNMGERKVAVIRTLLTRVPEDQWESEQTRSIMARALATLEVTK